MFLVDNGLGILANPEDENLLDIQEQMGGVLVAPGMNSGLVQTPSALNRWMEEAIILDADSIHDCISALKPAILAVVEKQRDEELAERRERRRKQQDEEAARRKKEEEEHEKNNENAAAATAPSVTMDVSTPQEAAVVGETPSFSSFFHGFNISTSTPLVRSRDHTDAETLATSIVEAVLGPAIETVANARPSAAGSPDHIDTALPHQNVETTTPSPAVAAAAAAAVEVVVIETATPLAESATPGVVDRSMEPTATPFNPIPNTTPGAPRPNAPAESIMEDQEHFIGRRSVPS